MLLYKADSDPILSPFCFEKETYYVQCKCLLYSGKANNKLGNTHLDQNHVYNYKKLTWKECTIIRDNEGLEHYWNRKVTGVGNG